MRVRTHSPRRRRADGEGGCCPSPAGTGGRARGSCGRHTANKTLPCPRTAGASHSPAPRGSWVCEGAARGGLASKSGWLRARGPVPWRWTHSRGLVRARTSSHLGVSGDVTPGRHLLVGIHKIVLTGTAGPKGEKSGSALASPFSGVSTGAPPRSNPDPNPTDPLALLAAGQ